MSARRIEARRWRCLRMNRLSELRADLLSPRIPRAVAVGFLMTAVIVIHCLALAAIVFNGPLLPFAVQGAGMMLFGAIVFCLVIGGASSYPGMLAYPQEIPATVIGTLGAGIVASTASAQAETAFATMVALMILSGLVTGLFFLAVGHFRLSNYFRFIPYPVAGGFFAGTGCVLVLAALSVMCGVALDWQTLPRILEPAMVWKWVPGVFYGLVLIVGMSRGNSFVTMMGSVAVLSVLYHLGLMFLDISVDDATARGLLLSGMPREDAPWPVFGAGDIAKVDWSAVARHVPDILTAALVTLLCLLVYVNGLEVSTGVEVDLDREFRVAGVAGVCAGAGGSVPGCQSFVLTLPCRRLGVDTPWIGIIVAAMLGLSLFYGTGVLELLPMSIIGGVLFFIGGDLLNTWLINARKRLHGADYAIIAVICVAIAVFGFIEGVGVGMLATLTLFAFRLSREEIVAEQYTARQRSSTRIRSVPDRALLLEHADLLRVYRLRGYIFFGSAHRLVDQLKQPMKERSGSAFVILDFAAVAGCDLSALMLLCQFARWANRTGGRVVICAASNTIETDMRNILAHDDRDAPWFETNLDHALERCEDAILGTAAEELSRTKGPVKGHLLERVAEDLEARLIEQIAFEEIVERLEPWLEPRDYEAGEALAMQGELQDGLHLVISGHVSAHDTTGRRLYQCGPGDVLEPWAAFCERAASATAIARSKCRTMVLLPTQRELLERDDKSLSLKVYSFLIRNQTSRNALFPPTHAGS